jgi:hypothetical protein
MMIRRSIIRSSYYISNYDRQRSSERADKKTTRKFEENVIPNDQPARRDMIDRMLHSLIRTIDDLTSWEQDFIQSIAGQFDRKGDLSDKQCEILERIYDKQ